MSKMDAKYGRYFDDAGHLNDLGMARCAEAVRLDALDELPEVLYRHMQSCGRCDVDLYELVEMLGEMAAQDILYKVVFNSQINALVSQLLMKKIEANPLLEKQMAELSEVRHESGRKLLWPLENAVCINDLTITWGKPPGERVCLSIINENDQLLLDEEFLADTAKHRLELPSGMFPTGRYHCIFELEYETFARSIFICTPGDALDLYNEIGL